MEWILSIPTITSFIITTSTIPENIQVSESTGTIWNITPVPGINIAGGPNIGGNYWADPNGTGWSQVHPDTGGGFTVPFDTTADGLNIDQHPLTLYGPAPPGPSPARPAHTT